MRDSPTILPPVISARINTMQNFNFLFGKVEVKAKLPSEDWIFPQIFLESTNSIYGKKNYDSGQMRVAFTRGRNTELHGGVLLSAREPFRSVKMCTNPDNTKWSNDFHVYTLEWTPGLFEKKKKIKKLNIILTFIQF